MSGDAAAGRVQPDRTFRRPRLRGLRRGGNAKIAGVCSGIAQHYGAEPWVVRCIALTGLIFMTSVAFMGYWILYFLMEEPPSGEAEQPPPGHGGETPALGAGLSPKRSLRAVRAHLAQAELRLRRMEHHVTSGQYELHREFNRIEPSSATRSPAR